MQIESARLGTIEIEQDKIIHFPQGILGFQEERQFALIPAGEDNPFYFLQSVTSADICFIVTEPHLFFKDYDIELIEEVVETLSIAKAEDVAIYTIVTIKENFKQSTTNLQAPLVVNANNFTALQYVVDSDQYITRQQLFPNSDDEVKEG